MYTAGVSVGQGVGNAAAVTDDVQTIITAHQLLVHFHFHVVELDLHAVEQGIVIGGTGGNLIQGLDHLNDAAQNTLGQHQAQGTGGGVQGGSEEGIHLPLGGGTAAADQIAEALDDHTAAQHIA